jgi:hypothetical protein
MSEVGNFCGEGRACTAVAVAAERSHWGLWSVVSSPLVLGFDLNRSDTMDRVWPLISNTEALAVNHAWAGHPGTLRKVYPMQGLQQIVGNWCQEKLPDGTAGPGCDVGLMSAFASCDTGGAATTGWKLTDGMLVAPQSGQATAQCLTTHSFAYGVDCPPPTMTSGAVGCGNIVMNCSRATFEGTWAFDDATGAVQYTPNSTNAKPSCLSATPMDVDLDKGYFTRKGWSVGMGDCPQAGKPAANSSKFTLTAKGELQLKVNSSVCIAVAPLNGPQLWSKTLEKGGKVAIVVVNPNLNNQSLTLPLADIPELSCGSTCQVRDVWRHSDVTTTVLPGGASDLKLELAPNDCAFLVIGGKSEQLLLAQPLKLDDDATTTTTAAAAGCQTDDDCQLNGVCTNGACDCDAAWSADDCGTLEFDGPGSLAYGGPAADITSWGGGPPVYHKERREWVLFVTEIGGHCGLSQWQHQSTVVAATAAHPAGPYTRSSLVIPTQAHNPYYAFDPQSSTHLLYHIGGGDNPESKTNPFRHNCVNGTTPPAADQTFAAAAEPIYSRQPYLHTAKLLAGPFQRVNFSLPAGHTPVGWGSDNPAPFVFENGTVLMLTRKYNGTASKLHIVPHDTIWLVRAQSYLGPYELVHDKPLFSDYENPFNEE